MRYFIGRRKKKCESMYLQISSVANTWVTIDKLKYSNGFDTLKEARKIAKMELSGMELLKIKYCKLDISDIEVKS